MAAPRMSGWSGQPAAVPAGQAAQNGMQWHQGQQISGDSGVTRHSGQSCTPSVSNLHMLGTAQQASVTQVPVRSGTVFQLAPGPASGGMGINQHQAQGGRPPPPPAVCSGLQRQPGFSLPGSSHSTPPPPPPRPLPSGALSSLSSTSLCSPGCPPAAPNSVTTSMLPSTYNPPGSVPACPPPPPSTSHSLSSFTSPSTLASAVTAPCSSRSFFPNPPPPPSSTPSSYTSYPAVPPPPSFPRLQHGQAVSHPPPPPVTGASRNTCGPHQRSFPHQTEQFHTDAASARFSHAAPPPGQNPWTIPPKAFMTSGGASGNPCHASPSEEEPEQCSIAGLHRDLRASSDCERVGPPSTPFSSKNSQLAFNGRGGPVPPPPPPEPSVATLGKRSRDGGTLPPQAGAKRKRMEEEPMCLLCDKTFRNVNKLKQHEEEEHVSCDVLGCEYKGPVHVMVMHKLKHLKNEKGESLLDNEAETAAWLAARKENFPSRQRKREADEKAKQKQTSGPIRLPPKPKSVLERILRETMTSAYGRRLIHPAFFSSALCPHLPKMLPRPPPICSLKRELRHACLPASPYTHPSGLQPSSFLVPAFGARGSGSRGTCWPEVPLRPPLLYQLLAPEVREYEAMLLAAISFIVKSNFFLDVPHPGEARNLVELVVGHDEAAAVGEDSKHGEREKTVENAADTERTEEREIEEGPRRACCLERVNERTPDCIVVA
ncbi:zinc finger (c2h2 type) [Cystoisospora suis]|uniref:Zinc finger (C2h2 type) n=1 Tax=Cystoisospora suis TaxID=483139 RepID=A0A2C6KP46_9APIC|nr:zinc finger (c2h2 type) [Cystoisospora suis]